MIEQSRTAKSLKNSTIALIFYVINICFQFFSRKVFLEYLGTDILGLNTTATNLLQFLNLAELGINTAVGFTLYKPLHENDHKAINEIITLQGHLYRRIACIITIGASILMCFFPLIFAKMELPLWYAYASFGVLLFSSLLGYFINYRQIILTASQQDYKVLYSYKSVMIIKTAIQMFAVWKFYNGYVWWLIFEVLFAVISSYTLRRMTITSFPFLRTINESFNTLKSRYPEFTVKIKQLFFHRIGGFALTQSSPIIIYAFTNLNIVTLYGNYIMITTGIQGMVCAIFNSMGAGIGNLVTEGNYLKIINVFNELFSVRFLIASILCYCTFSLTPSFITLWIGSEYILPESTLLLIVALLFISIIRLTVDNFINAYGIFSDIYAPIIEAFLNVGCSIFLGKFYGLNGVICGIIISQILIVLIWKPFYLFTKGLRGSLIHYWIEFIKHLTMSFIVAIVTINIMKLFSIKSDVDIISFILASILQFLIYSLGLISVFLIFTSGMRAFIHRIFRRYIN